MCHKLGPRRRQEHYYPAHACTYARTYARTYAQLGKVIGHVHLLLLLPQKTLDLEFWVLVEIVLRTVCIENRIKLFSLLLNA